MKTVNSEELKSIIYMKKYLAGIGGRFSGTDVFLIPKAFSCLVVSEKDMGGYMKTAISF